MKKSWSVNSKEIKTENSEHATPHVHLILSPPATVLFRLQHGIPVPDESRLLPTWLCTPAPSLRYSHCPLCCMPPPFLTPAHSLGISPSNPTLLGKHPWPLSTLRCLLSKTHYKHWGSSHLFRSVKPLQWIEGFLLPFFPFAFFGGWRSRLIQHVGLQKSQNKFI